MQVSRHHPADATDATDAADAAEAGTAQPSRRDWQEVFALLDMAWELEPSALPTWIESLAPEQARLSPLLRQLLQDRVGIDTGDFMRSPPKLRGTAAAPRFALVPQGRVGPYRLLREIGQGGMASVWLAERADGLLERRLALKLPHVSWGAATFADRMARERNILASLTHPHIARLYDAGIADDGRPYLALEYVDGQPIDVHAATQGLSVRARVVLIVQVARAVAHAHARLIAHRDLKPSNILVDAQGQAHLLDFGIAKLVDAQLDDGAPASQLTRQAGRALTPDYASPEQIRGDATGTATDVYSLGVVLFELLAGARPYRLPPGLSAVALAEALAAIDPPRASAVARDVPLQRQLKGDLDAILARALAKPSTDRYASIDAFADDLERHLRGEPVQARPDSRWYRTERWVRRHPLETAVGVAILIAVPAGAAAQVAVLAAIASGAGAVAWQAKRARRQARLAKEEAARAAAVKTFLTSFFKSGSLADDAGARLGQLTVQQFVERGARKIDDGFAHQPALKTELFDVVSALFADLSDGAATANYAHKWLSTLECIDASDAERARATQRLAQGLALLGRHAEASERLAQGLALLRRRSTDPALLAHLLVDQARQHAELGEPRRALDGVDEALTLLSAPADAPASTAAAHALALFLRAQLLAADNRFEQAVPGFEDAIARMAQWHGEQSAAVAHHRYLFGMALQAEGDDTAAEREYRQALLLFQQAGGESVVNAGIVALELGHLLSVAGTTRAEGLALMAHARSVFTRHGDSISALHAAAASLYLADALIDDSDLAAAAEPLQMAVALFKDRVEHASLRTEAHQVHARFLSECGQYDAAHRLLMETHAERSRLMGPHHPLTGSVMNRIGLNHLRREDFVQAVAAFQSALATDAGGSEGGSSARQMARHNLAVAELDSGNVVLGLRAFEQHVAALEDEPQADHNVMAVASRRLHLGRALMLNGQFQRALPLLQHNVDLLAPLYPDNLGLAGSRSWLGRCVLGLGDVAQARRLSELAHLALDKQPMAGPHYRRSLARLDEQLAAHAAAG